MLAEIFGVDGIIVLIVVLVLLFGGAAIPKLARSLGSAKNEFESGLQEGKDASATAAAAAPAGGGGSGVSQALQVPLSSNHTGHRSKA